MVSPRYLSKLGSETSSPYIYILSRFKTYSIVCSGRGSLVGDVFWFSPPTAQFYVKTFRGRFDYLFPSFQLFYIKFSILCFVLEQIYFDTQIEVNAPKMRLSLGSW